MTDRMRVMSENMTLTRGLITIAHMQPRPRVITWRLAILSTLYLAALHQGIGKSLSDTC